MWNAAIKKRVVLITCLATICFVAVNCGGSKRAQAEQMLSEAAAMDSIGHYHEALCMLDTLDSVYSGEVQIRREAMHLRPLVQEHLYMMQLQRTDSIIAMVGWQLDSLWTKLQKISNPIEPYLIAPSQPVHPDRAGVYGQIAPDGRLCVTIISGNNTPINSLSAECAGQSFTIGQISNDGERHALGVGGVRITLSEQESVDLCQLLDQGAGAMLSIYLSGGNANAELHVSDKQAEDLLYLYSVSKLVMKRKKLQLEKLKYEKLIQVSRNHAARTFKDSDPTTKQ